jgi:tetratricopeptide (TPR) repeat protein
MQEYSQPDLTRLFHLPGSLIRALSRAGFIPETVEQSPTHYSLQDLLILRLAGALKAADIPAAKIPSVIGKIRAALPPGSVLTTTKNAAEEAQGRAPDQGGTSRTQVLLATAHYSRGHALEDSDVAGARAAYLDALNAHSDHLESRINLGRLLHLNGELREAEKVYRQAKSSSALLSFNLAILLEDLEREEEAVAAYREALAQDPTMHDAHFNLSRLHEKADQPREALRHLLAYRRHVARYGD